MMEMKDEPEIFSPLYFTSAALFDARASGEGGVDSRLYTKTRDEAAQGQFEQRRIGLARLAVRLCKRMGFPYATKSSALMLLSRFAAFQFATDSEPVADVDLVIASVFVACKVEETVKKARDLILGLHSTLKEPGDKDLEYDSPEVEEQKRRVIHIERLMLESVCFDFNQIKTAHKIVVQFAKLFGVPKEVTQKAWLMADESYYTLVSIQYPAHFIAFACLYLSSRLMDCEAMPAVLVPAFAQHYFCRLTGVIDVCLQVIQHFRQSDWLHDPAVGIDLLKLSNIGNQLEAELTQLIQRRIFSEVEPPPMPPQIVPHIPQTQFLEAPSHVHHPRSGLGVSASLKRVFPQDEYASKRFSSSSSYNDQLHQQRNFEPRQVSYDQRQSSSYDQRQSSRFEQQQRHPNQQSHAHHNQQSYYEQRQQPQYSSSFDQRTPIIVERQQRQAPSNQQFKHHQPPPPPPPLSRFDQKQAFPSNIPPPPFEPRFDPPVPQPLQQQHRQPNPPLPPPLQPGGAWFSGPPTGSFDSRSTGSSGQQPPPPLPPGSGYDSRTASPLLPPPPAFSSRVSFPLVAPGARPSHPSSRSGARSPPRHQSFSQNGGRR
ncbi:hypothetical protein BC830DRAFT_1169108 [Chytriomyces sp. MP71]|nr:hypothetical protein BC830DRAFT_1169108 [Chytriomyces sp. MP71]